MAMELKCQSRGMRCPPYKHTGGFQPHNENIKRLLPDLKRCATCMANTAPKLPYFRDDLLQIASITLVEKGPSFNPNHTSGASFGTFIRPRICLRLTNARKKELLYYTRETCVAETLDEDEIGVPFIESVPDRTTDSFVDALIWDLSVARFHEMLPLLSESLSAAEQKVLGLIREDMRNCEIAEELGITRGYVSQLTASVEKKLRRACLKHGLIEDIP